MASTHLHLKEAQHERNLLFLMSPVSLTLLLLQNQVIFPHNTYSDLLHFVAYMLGAKMSLDENDVQ